MYFAYGQENTEKTVELAVNTARERGIRHIVVASNSGYTAGLLKDADDLEAVCVTHVNGLYSQAKTRCLKTYAGSLWNRE